MKKILILVFFTILVILAKPTVAQDRFAACDLCGFCPPSAAPQSWAKCQICIYPEASSDPSVKDTLLINPDANTAPTPFPGRFYSMLGCIKTDLGSFQSEGAAGSVMQILLNLIFGVVGGIALIYFIYGTFLILTSQSDPEKLNQGKQTISGAIIGLLFSLSSVFLINLIASGILKIPGFGGGSTP